MNDSELWLHRAQLSWEALDRVGLRRRSGRVTVKEPGGVRAVPLWPFSQVLHTAIALSSAQVVQRGVAHDVLTALESYRSGEAYAERPTNNRRYYDDNAWVALATIDYDTQQSLDTARRILTFLHQGSDELVDGVIGVRWVEKGLNHHACSTGSTGLAAARLANRGVIDRGEGMSFARGCAGFLGRLQDADGLVRDHQRPDGGIDGAIYTYNQGLTVGLLVEIGKLDEAAALASRTMKAFHDQRLWAHAPAFNSIFIRELMRLHRVVPDPVSLTYCQRYLERVWNEARNPATGGLAGGGIGTYDKGTVLDHAGLVHAMFALGTALGSHPTG